MAAPQQPESSGSSSEKKVKAPLCEHRVDASSPLLERLKSLTPKAGERSLKGNTLRIRARPSLGADLKRVADEVPLD
jgi:hypothetical protein